MLIQTYVLPINPEPWAIGEVSSGKTGKRITPNAQLVNYQEAVKQYIQQNYPGYQMFNCECELNFYFWRRLDVYMTRGGRPHMRHTADATNLQKGLEDALQGVVISNDKLVRRTTSEVVEQAHNIDPGIIIIAKQHYEPKYTKELGPLLGKLRLTQQEANNIDLDNVA